MDTLPKLSPAQSLLLRTAARRADGRVIPPDTLRGGARVKVLTALLQRGWIDPAGDDLVLMDAGYAAIGQQRPAPPDDVQPMDTIGDLQLLDGIPVRPGTKLAALVTTLRRPQGATGLQLMLATGWQPHTVRGAISGMLRKKLGLNVVLVLNDAGERVYRVV
jgi:stage V sporulation protein SpoVS